MPEKLLTSKEIQTRLGISKSSFWRFVKCGKLPPPLRLGPQTRRWRADAVDAAIDRLTAPPN